MSQFSNFTKTLVYGAAEMATAGRGIKRVIGGECIRFPVRWAHYYDADYEPSTFKFLRQHCRIGNTVLDIGAHIGLFSVLMARSVGPTGQVFSFEPTPLTKEVLQKTVEMNGCGPVVEVRAEAVAKVSGQAMFFDTGHLGSNANSLVQGEEHVGMRPTETIAIDDFVASRDLQVNCLKIDVEGAELDVLLGAQQTFDVHRPALSLALHPKAIQQARATLDDIWEVLQDSRLSVIYLDEWVKKIGLYVRPIYSMFGVCR